MKSKTPVYNPSWLNSNINLPKKNGFIGYTAKVFKDQEKKAETKKSAKVVLNGFEGCICAKCKEFYPYAEPNMDDGTMVCYACRHPWLGFEES